MIKKQSATGRVSGMLKNMSARISYESMQVAVAILIFMAGVAVGASWVGGTESSIVAPSASESYSVKSGQDRPHYIVKKDSLW